MEKRGKINKLGVILAILLIAIIGFVVYWTIKNLQITNTIATNYHELSTRSRLIIAGEWLLILVIILVVLVKGKMRANKIEKIKVDPSLLTKYKKSRSETDIDVLYEILKEKKNLTFPMIEKLFNVKRQIVMNWGEILESGNLAEIRYPTVGDPRLVLKEGKDEEEE